MFPRFGLLALLLVPAPLGCVTLPFLSPDADKPASKTAELPPDKAAAVSLATAQELEKVGNVAEAIVEYEKAHQYNPKLTQVARRLAVLYDRRGNFERTLAEYRLALEQTPRDADLLNDLGYCHYLRGDWAEAEKCLRQAVALKPDQSRAWGNLALVLASQERYADSYEAFAKVVSPGEAHANVGIIQAQQGKREEARQSLHQALDLAPELQAAKAILARVDDPRPFGTETRDAQARVATPAAPAGVAQAEQPASKAE